MNSSSTTTSLDSTWSAEGLSDLENIRAVKAQYFRSVDLKQWDQLREVFTDTAKFEGLWAASDTPEGFVSNIQNNLGPEVITIHHGYTPQFTRLDDDRIRGVWAMTDYLTWPPGERAYLGVSLPGQCGVRGYGFYEEEYLRTAQGWKIDFLRLSRIRIDPILEQPEAPDYPFVAPDPQWLRGQA